MKIHLLGDKKYLRFLESVEYILTDSPNNADYILVGFRNPIPPRLYNESMNYVLSPMGKFEADNIAETILGAAMKNTPIIGIEGGLHLINTMYGGKSIQNVTHSIIHPIQFDDGDVVNVLNPYSQIVSLKDVNPKNYNIIAKSCNNSPLYFSSEESDPEIYLFKENGKYVEPMVVEYDIAIGFNYGVDNLEVNSNIKQKTKDLIYYFLN